VLAVPLAYRRGTGSSSACCRAPRKGKKEKKKGAKKAIDSSFLLSFSSTPYPRRLLEPKKKGKRGKEKKKRGGKGERGKLHREPTTREVARFFPYVIAPWPRERKRGKEKR